MNLSAGNFQERLRTARLLIGLSQEDLAKQMGRPALSVSRWERGKSNPIPSNAARLAVALRVNMRWLLLGEGPMECRPATTKDPVAAGSSVSSNSAR